MIVAVNRTLALTAAKPVQEDFKLRVFVILMSVAKRVHENPNTPAEVDSIR